MTSAAVKAVVAPDALPSGKGKGKDVKGVPLVEARVESGRPRSATEGGNMNVAMDLAPGEVHPAHKPSLPSHDAIKASPHYPVIVTPNAMVSHQVCVALRGFFGGVRPNCDPSRTRPTAEVTPRAPLTNPPSTHTNKQTMQLFNGVDDPAKHLALNGDMMELESDLFKGTIAVHLRGLPTTKKHIFEGKKRFFQIAVQVRVVQLAARLAGAWRPSSYLLSRPHPHTPFDPKQKQKNKKTGQVQAPRRGERAVHGPGVCQARQRAAVRRRDGADGRRQGLQQQHAGRRARAAALLHEPHPRRLPAHQRRQGRRGARRVGGQGGHAPL